eukprot:scaffold33859_cov64-Phaeocystis_antarctica.AAC.1
MELGPGGLSAPQGAAGTWRTGPGTATAAIRRYAAALWVCAAEPAVLLQCCWRGRCAVCTVRTSVRGRGGCPAQ